MSCELVVRVLNGRNNVTNLVIGTLLNGVNTLQSWAGVTRFTLEFTDADGDPVVVDTDDDPTAIVTGTPGRLTLALGLLDLPVGSFEARLFLYSPTYPQGFLLDDGEGFTFTLEVTL